ncbi:MAG: hypothetical protein C0595_01005 [Marinilabiliales bacterium]|nr:MAG: hypothetical protein C0595_01005 [Marinilabiliales bacterium]
MKQLAIFVISLFFISSLSAQYINEPETLSDDIAIDSLLKLHKSFNQKYKSISGYRIQIFKGSGNSSLENARLLEEEFTEKYSGTPTYLSFQEPYYRIRIGDFRTRLDAINFLTSIKDDYPSAFVIQDNIEFVELPKYQKSLNHEQENSSRY